MLRSISVYRHAAVITPVARWALIARGTAYSNRFPVPSGCGLPHLCARSATTLVVSRPAQRSLAITACRLAASPKATHLSRRLRRFRFLHRRSDSYRLERPSCRVRISLAEDQHLTRITAHTKSDPRDDPRDAHRPTAGRASHVLLVSWRGSSGGVVEKNQKQSQTPARPPRDPREDPPAVSSKKTKNKVRPPRDPREDPPAVSSKKTKNKVRPPRDPREDPPAVSSKKTKNKVRPPRDPREDPPAVSSKKTKNKVRPPRRPPRKTKSDPREDPREKQSQTPAKTPATNRRRQTRIDRSVTV